MNSEKCTKYQITNGKIYFDDNFEEPLVKYISVMRNHSGVFLMKGKGTNYKHEIVLTKNLRELTLAGVKFKKLKLPKNLIILHLSYNSFICVKLTKKLKSLQFYCTQNVQIILTKNINDVRLGDSFNMPIFLTKEVGRVVFGKNFNQPIVLPKKITCLYFSECFNQPFKPSPNLNNLTLGRDFSQNIIFGKMIKHFKIDIHIVKPIHFQLFSYLPNNSNATKIECYLKNVSCTITKSGRFIDHYAIREEFMSNIKSNVPKSTYLHYYKYTPELY